MNFVNKCMKTFHGIFLATFAITASALIAYGSFAFYLILVTNSSRIIQELGTTIPSIITIVLGVLLIVLVIIGLCGILRNSSCCLQSYCYLLAILALTQIVFGAYGVIQYNDPDYKANLELQITIDMVDSVKNYTANPQKMDQIQKLLKCCGHEDPLVEYNENELPSTCCHYSENICTKYGIYKEPCTPMVYLITLQSNFIMGWISLTIGGTELIVSLLGICLFYCLWRD